MSGHNLPLVYWDTCIFLALLKQEQRQDPADLEGTNEQSDLFDKGQLQIATSVITIIEVLRSSISQAAGDRFEKLGQRPNFFFVDTTSRIARIAHDIRDYYYNVQDGLPPVSTQDSIHLATAIYFGCDKLYTFDEKNKPGKNRALIPLSGTIAGHYPLIIEKPRPSIMSLPMFSGGNNT